VPDVSNGYDEIAEAYVSRRSSAIGVAEVRAWAEGLPPGAAVLDLGCGHGVPISDTLIQSGCRVHAIDASPRLAAAFHARFPDVPIACEAIEDSPFFNRPFDAAIAWGVMFLLPLDSQSRVIRKVAQALTSGGSFLFTAPAQELSWPDVITRRVSMSPGAEAYRRMLTAEGLTVVRELDDEGENHYYVSIKA
jgi:cyclopropane fatty-acyl-phospholipid synthase-like methyltransferase